MGKRGPKRTPLRVLENRDSKLVTDRQHEPQAPTGDMTHPEYLSTLAREYWAELYPVLCEMKVLTLADRHCLAMTCVNLAEAQEIYRRILESREAGIGEKALRLARADMHRCHDMANKMMDRLGLSPGARANLKVMPPAEQKGKRERFFGTG